MLTVFLRWWLSLAAKFARVVPLQTAFIIVLTLVSQVSSLLASFLPLKVVILLGSEHIPSYMPDSWAILGRDLLVACLSAAALGFFVLYLLIERLIGGVTARATQFLMGRSDKLEMFQNQQEIAREAYRCFSRGLAGGVFILLALLGLAVFYPKMAGVILAYLVLVVSLTLLWRRRSTGFHEYLHNKLSAFTALLATVGFFVCFGYLVADFLLWDSPKVMIAILALLLTRQVMNRTAGLASDFVRLQLQRIKLDAIFFHGRVLLPQEPNHTKGIWPLLQPASRQAWVQQVLGAVVAVDEQPIECHWMQLGLANVGALRVRGHADSYLLKLYDTNRKTLAVHEATLLGESNAGLPVLEFVGVSDVQGVVCHVLKLPEGVTPAPGEVKRLLPGIRQNLLSITPSSALLALYRRSKPMLSRRLTPALFERIAVVAEGDESRALLLSAQQRVPVMQAILDSLPVVVLNPDIVAESIWLPKDGGSPLLLNWGRWSLEPLGCGWPETTPALESLAEALREGAALRPELESVSVQHAELAALLFAMERECSKQRFIQAFALLPAIMCRLDATE